MNSYLKKKKKFSYYLILFNKIKKPFFVISCEGNIDEI